MTTYNPDRSEWKTVWLGDPLNTAHADAGWLPIEAEVRNSQLAVFERKVTIGDASKDSDDYISSWIVSDLSGGLGILNLNEGTDTNKFYFGVAETRFASQVALPPLSSSVTKPTGVAGGAYPLGDVYSTKLNDRGSTEANSFYVAWGPDPSNSNHYNVYGYDESGSAWRARASAGSHSGRLTNKPLEKGTPFCGYADNGITSLYVPLGGSGYARITESTTGVATVTCVSPSEPTVGASGGYPAAVTFCSFTDRLWALDDKGRLWKTPGKNPGGSDDVWTLIQSPSETSAKFLEMRYDRSQTPRKLISYVNRSGEPALCLVTDSGLLMFEEMDTESGRWQQTAVQYPPHPDFGLAAAVWRPGEDLHIAAGMDTVRFTSANVIVPLSGPNSGDGLPNDSLGRIVDFAPELSCLYALVDGTEDTTLFQYNLNSILAWTSTGWHCVWQGESGVQPTWMCVSKVAGTGYKLWWGFSDGKVYAMRLRRTFHNPRSGFKANNTGLDEYAGVGYVATGRFDANMTGFDRIASHVVIDMENATATEKVSVSFRSDVTMKTNDNWVTLGDVTAKGVSYLSLNPVNQLNRTAKDGVPTNEVQPAADVSTSTFDPGVRFNWIEFLLFFSRDPAKTKVTPIMRSFMLGFVKIPQNTQSFVFTVPLPKRTWNGRTAGEIVDHLNSLLTYSGFLGLIHHDQFYRVKVAGVSGADATGDDFSGARTVNVIAIPGGP